MQYRTTLALLFLAAGLVAFILFVERHQETTDDRFDRDVRGRILDVSWGDIRRLDLERKGVKLALELVREPSDWEIVEPFKQKASAAAVNDILNRFEFFREKSRLKPPPGGAFDLKEFGLDPPEIVVTIHYRDRQAAERKATLRLGKAVAIGSQPDHYAMLDGRDGVFMVDPQLFKALDQSPSALVERKAFNLEIDGVDRITLEAAAPDGGTRTGLELKRDTGGWWIAGAPDSPTDPEEMKRLLRTIATLEAVDWLPDGSFDPKAAGLAEPALVATVEDRVARKSVTLSIGAKVPPKDPEKEPGKGPAGAPARELWYASRAGSTGAFTIPADAVAQLEPGRSRLRSKVYFDVPDHVVRRLKLQAPGVRVELAREEDRWRSIEPTGLDVDYGAVHTFLSILRIYPVVEFLGPAPPDLAPYGLAEPQIVFTLWMSYGEPVVEREYGFRVGWKDAEPDKVYGLTSSGAELVRVDPAVKDAFRRGALQFRRKALLTIPRSRLREFTVEHALPAGAKRVQTAARTPGDHWVVRQDGAEKKPDSDVTIESIVDHITDVYALAFEADGPPDLAPFGLDRPELTVSFRWNKEEDPAAGQAVETLRIGGETPEGTRHCKLDSSPLVFSWEKSTVRYFQRDLLLPPEDPREEK